MKQARAGGGWLPRAGPLGGTRNNSGYVRELAREIRNGLRIDLALVPLLNHGEVRAAGLPVLAALPAVTCKIVRGRCQPVGRAAPEIAAAITIEIDREFDVGGRHELGLADFAGPGAAHFLG